MSVLSNLLYNRQFVVRQTLGPEIGAAELRGDTVGDLISVAGQHCDPFYSNIEQLLDGVAGFGSGFVLKANPADAL